MSMIGKPVDRVDGRLKVTGAAKYAAEFAPPNLAYAAVVESAIPAGRIAVIDTADAEKSPGVLLVLTHLNADKLPYLPFQERPAVEPVAGNPLRVLQDADIKFSGQPIGPRRSRNPGAGRLRRLARPRHLSSRSAPAKLVLTRSASRPVSEAAEKRERGPEWKRGDADAALAAAPVRVKGVYVQPREHHNAMEPHATVALWENDRLTLWDKSQWVDNVRDENGAYLRHTG